MRAKPAGGPAKLVSERENMIVRDTNETTTFKIEDAEFTIRVISRKVFRKLGSKLVKVISKVRGTDDTAALTPERIKEIVSSEDGLEAGEALIEAYAEYVRHGIVGHSGLKTAAGVELPFEKEVDGTVSPKTIDLYDNNGFISKLAVEVLNFNTLSEKERKN